MKQTRKPSCNELSLIKKLVDSSLIKFQTNWENDLLVSSINDGDMGSLLLFPNGIVNKNRVFGKQISEYQFKDEDGIKVIVSLNVDKSEALFELDIWKTDFSRLIKLPEILSNES